MKELLRHQSLDVVFTGVFGGFAADYCREIFSVGLFQRDGNNHFGIFIVNYSMELPLPSANVVYCSNGIYRNVLFKGTVLSK
jgi:hypothetical protein